MLNKKNRLTSNSSFKATYCQNRVVSDEFFTLFAGKTNEKEEVQTRIGFVVAKKVHKRAVIRNKIKRRMREALKNYLKEKKIPFISLIFKAKANSINADYKITLNSIYNLIDRMAKKYF